MKFKTSEIYLTEKYISIENWNNFINTISNYNGILRKWKIIISNDKNQMRYFVKTRCSLPSTINNLDSFLLKDADNIELPSSDSILLMLPKAGSSIIDIVNNCEIKNKGTFKYLEIIFRKFYEDKISADINLYLEKSGKIKKYLVAFANPTNLLSVDFNGNKRYFFKEVPKYLDINKILHLLDSDSKASVLKIDTFPYLQGDFYLNQNNYNFNKHSVVIGSSGSGKSKFISLLINNIHKNSNLRQNYKIVVIDPHASLENDIGGLAKVIDFKTKLDSIDLFINNNGDVVSSTELLLELLKSLISDQYNSKLERVLRHAIHILLTDEIFNFSNLRKLLLDTEYRNDLIRKLKYVLPSSVIDFFLSDFNELKTKSYGEAISPIIAFIDEMEMIPVFNEQNDVNNLKNTILDNFLTVFSLDRTKLGDKVTKTIAGLVMQQLLTLIQSCEINEHIIFIIDEVSVVENPILSRFLSEARKYNLSLILAGQYFSQISEDLKNAIFANVVNYYIFRVSKLDANILVDNFNMKIPLDDTKERKIKLLTELNNRECIVRLDSKGILLPAFKATTLYFESIPRIKNNIYEEKNTNNITNTEATKKSFKIDSTVKLKDILISNSSSRKVVKDNE